MAAAGARRRSRASARRGSQKLTNSGPVSMPASISRRVGIAQPGSAEDRQHDHADKPSHWSSASRGGAPPRARVRAGGRCQTKSSMRQALDHDEHDEHASARRSTGPGMIDLSQAGAEEKIGTAGGGPYASLTAATSLVSELLASPNRIEHLGL